MRLFLVILYRYCLQTFFIFLLTHIYSVLRTYLHAYFVTLKSKKSSTLTKTDRSEKTIM